MMYVYVRWLINYTQQTGSISMSIMYGYVSTMEIANTQIPPLVPMSFHVPDIFAAWLVYLANTSVNWYII